MNMFKKFLISLLVVGCTSSAVFGMKRDASEISGGNDSAVPKSDQTLFDLGMRVSGIGTIYHLAISSDGKLLASVAEEQDDENPRVFDPSDDEADLTFNGKVRLSLWNMETQTLIWSITGIKSYIYSLAISPDNNILAVGYFGEVRLLNLKIMKCVHIFKTHEKSVQAIAFSPNGNILAFDSMHEYIELWDLTTMTRTHKLVCGDYVRAIAFDPSGNILAFCGWLGDRSIKVLCKENNKCIHDVAMREVSYCHDDGASTSSDGKFLIFKDENEKIKLFNLTSMTSTCVFDIGHSKITALAYNSCCAKIAIGLEKGGLGSIVILPNNFVRERKDAIFALACAQSPKLGIKSPAQSLTELTLRLIYEMYDTNVQLFK